MLVYYFKSIDSTQSFLKRLINNEDVFSMPIACIAKVQYSGYGRRGSRWESDIGGLYFSLFLPKLEGNIQIQSVAGVAMCLRNLFDIEVSIKWPNDIFFQDRKLAGILLEKAAGGIILGVGINVNNKVSSGLNAISLKEILYRHIDTAGLFYAVLNYLIALPSYSEACAFFRKNLLGKGREWEFLTPSGNVIRAVLEGITDDGAVCLSGEKFLSGRLIRQL